MALTTRQATRLAYLLKNRPKDPEVAKLQALSKSNAAAATPAPAPAPNQPTGGGPVAADPEPEAEQPDSAQVGLTPRQAARLAWLQKNRPNDPQVAQLKAQQSRQAAPAPAPAAVDADPEPAAEDAAPGQAGLTPRQAARLAWLLKNRPKDPQVAKLKALQTPAAANPATGSNPTTTDPNLKADGTPDPGTEGLGETATTVDNFLNGIFGNLKPLDLSGAPKILSADDLAGARQSVWDSTYRQNTKDLDRQKQLRMEDTKQELAQRGIPINFGDDNLYGRAVGDINRDFDARDQAARDAANLQADNSLATLTGVNKTNRDAFVESATTQYKSQLDSAVAGGNVLQTLMTKFGLSQEAAQKELDRRLTLQISKADNKVKMAAINKPTGGGGGGGGSSTPGFQIVNAEAP